MPEQTVNVAIKKPLHAKLRRLAKAEQKTVRTITNNILSEGVSQHEQQPQHAAGKS